MLPGGGMATPPSDYSLYDHLERLRYLEVEAPEQETKSLRDVFQTALPGLEAFITDERHAMLKGKMAYNAYGVVYNGGRDDKVHQRGSRPTVNLTKFLVLLARACRQARRCREDAHPLRYPTSNRVRSLLRFCLRSSPSSSYLHDSWC